jgi:hypothetical protein
MRYLLDRQLTSLAFAVLLACGLAGAVAGESSDTATDTASTVPELSCTMNIETLRVDNMKLDDTLDVSIDAIGFDPAGFTLRIAVASGQVDIVDILPGEIIDSCGWDMFTARPAPPSETGRSPHAVWLISGLARGFADSTAPPCFVFDRPASLARLVVSSAHLPAVPDTTAAVFFYWESCRDNIMSDVEGLSIILSDSVSFGVPLFYETEPDRFPTTFGSPSECVRSRAYAVPQRLVDYVSGGVVFKFEMTD